MRARCYNPKDKGYDIYGGRGIRIEPTWDDYTVFKSWALSNGYQDNLTIDRKDRDKGYYPDNCQWITKSENSAKVSHDNKRAVLEAFKAGYKLGHIMGRMGQTK
ncbi:unnamed protein product [marine sediment metagenome]|uniref:Uncharacterized protein n=1 Tax=marine sediment metagenome TaxID=412755 RepID=X1CZ82_9ZZZZ